MAKHTASSPELRDLEKYEWVPVVVLMALIVLIGVYPSVLSEPLQSTLETIMLRDRRVMKDGFRNIAII